MPSPSFSAEVKEHLLTEVLPHEKFLQDCCHAAFDAGRDGTEPVLRCKKDGALYLRGVFLSFGSITDPKKQFYLSLFAPEEKLTTIEKTALEENVPFRRCYKKGKLYLYLRDSGEIEDFLARIGASRYALQLMEAKVIRQVRGEVNRANNADLANLDKAATASAEQVEAILLLKAEKRFATLPEPLRTAAELRLAHPECSLSELCMLHEGKISRSGLNHRLARLVEEANKKQ